MEWDERIRQVDEQEYKGEKERENILHKEKGGGALNVVDDPTSFCHNSGHGTEIVFK